MYEYLASSNVFLSRTTVLGSGVLCIHITARLNGSRPASVVYSFLGFGPTIKLFLPGNGRWIHSSLVFGEHSYRFGSGLETPRMGFADAESPVSCRVRLRSWTATYLLLLRKAYTLDFGNITYAMLEHSCNPGYVWQQETASMGVRGGTWRSTDR